MDTSKQAKKANLETINRAKFLLEKAGLTSPTLRYLSEIVIDSQSEQGILELITLLEECINEKEKAYMDFKSKVTSSLKKYLQNSYTFNR